MSTSVRIAALKANLSAVLRRVRQGEKVVVMDRDTAVAELTPIALPRPALTVRRAKATLATLRLPRPLKTRRDIVALLIDERGER
jgi:antitoxin (DNA-binding transcriptional repressor) of toxin-antitoxin stability system